MKLTSIDMLAQRREALVQRAAALAHEVRVCAGTACVAAGAGKLSDAIQREAAAKGLVLAVDGDAPDAEATVRLVNTGCQGLCQAGPLVRVLPQDAFYCGVRPKQAARLVSEALQNNAVIADWCAVSPQGQRYATRAEVPFYRHQQAIALEGCGAVAPESLDDYIAHGGFAALVRALEMPPEDIVQTVEDAGLRGRGGGGFSTGRKWRIAASASASERYVICNGDEGDPGAFMDCAIMEGDPFRIIEGMAIAARAIGAQQGFIYVRHEYPKAVARLDKTIVACRKAGLLGAGILGAGFDFDVEIARGGGAFVCGESTALMRSIEGQVGEPRANYIRSVQEGLYGQPTVLNNVETFACVPAIIERGAAWFAATGTPGSSGTKAFCLVGKVAHTGLIEVPMGTTLRQVIFDIGGGVLDGRPFKAVQTGGPSGGCLGEAQLDLPVDFDALTAAGSMMGSGGMIVMDDRTCMVDVAHYYLSFLQSESCGRCVPCREGVAQLCHLLDTMRRGTAKPGDLDRAIRLAQDIAQASLCSLGKSAPNPFLSAVTHFRAEFEAHINDRTCSAGVCRDLTVFAIDAQACTGCGLCAPACPADAIAGAPKQVHAIDAQKCTGCGACRTVCRDDAVRALPRNLPCN
ncbi:MAG: 4Fe-4S binding protein [Proteobacteria bacterium]|nr:4Fe-4S binding protein [Pseudomonadota bacterium]